MRALKGLFGPTLSAALAAGSFLALSSPTRTQEVVGVEEVVEDDELAGVGSLSGVVTDIDFEHSRVRIATGSGEVWLRARPFELATLGAGEDVTLRYAIFGEELWVSPVFLAPLPRPAPGTSGAPDGGWRSLTGVLEQVSVGDAVILVEDIPIQVHPRQAVGLTPGQLVSVTYVALESGRWAGAIDPVGAAGTSGRAGIGAENFIPGRPTEGVGPGVPVGPDAFPRNSYPVPGYHGETFFDELGPVGVQSFPPEERDDPADLEEDED